MTISFGPRLDPATLLFGISMLAALMAVVAFSSARALTAHSDELRKWGWSMAMGSGAFLLFYLRGHIPWFVAFVGANLLVLGCMALGLAAHQRLLGERSNYRQLWGVAAFGIGGTAATFFLGASPRLTVVTMSAALAFFLFRTAWALVRSNPWQRTPAALISALATGVVALSFASRIVTGLVGDVELVAPASGAAKQIGMLLTGAVYIVAASIGFFALVHEMQRRSALESSRRDGLTGLYTRTAFFELARQVEVEVGLTPFAIVMVDIDHFKNINDTFGHAGGDVVLAHAARLVASAVRSSDVAGRYGGEEFAVFLPNCKHLEAQNIAERLVQEARLTRVRLRDGRAASFSFSAGFAVQAAVGSQGSAVDEALADVLERADQALYRAKRSGRDRVCAAQPLVAPAPVAAL